MTASAYPRAGAVSLWNPQRRARRNAAQGREFRKARPRRPVEGTARPRRPPSIGGKSTARYGKSAPDGLFRSATEGPKTCLGFFPTGVRVSLRIFRRPDDLSTFRLMGEQEGLGDGGVY
jgi:hypothetical protein